MNSFILCNVRIVTPYDVIENGFIYVKRGIIETIGQTSPQKVHRSCNIIDGHGYWLFPGIIDLYNELPEKVTDDIFYSLENSFVSHGVTSIYHYLSEKAALDINYLLRLKRLGIIRHNIRSNISFNSLYVAVGAEGIIREAANSSNIRISDIIENNSEYVICSDQMNSPIIQTIFILYHIYGTSMTEAVGMTTINPARALGIDRKLGSIEYGKTADMVLVRDLNGLPVVEKVFVSGCKVYENSSEFTIKLHTV